MIKNFSILTGKADDSPEKAGESGQDRNEEHDEFLLSQDIVQPPIHVSNTLLFVLLLCVYWVFCSELILCALYDLFSNLQKCLAVLDGARKHSVYILDRYGNILGKWWKLVINQHSLENERKGLVFTCAVFIVI